MTIEFLSNILSPKTIEKIRKSYNRFKRFWYPELTEEKFKQILTNELGLKKDSVVFIHSAVDKLNLGFSFFQIIPILLEAVGEEGTLVFPCWQSDARAEDYLKENEIFDVNKTPTVMGIVPELARRYKNAFRSLHPTNSIVAIGKHASEITKDHINSTFPCDEHSAFYKIMKYDGIIIGLGVSTYNLSFVHCVEDVMNVEAKRLQGKKFPVKTRTDDLFDARVRDREGKIIPLKVRVAHLQIKYRNIEKYMLRYISTSICRDLKINGVKYFTASSCELFTEMKSLAEKGITIYAKKADIKN